MAKENSEDNPFDKKEEKRPPAAEGADTKGKGFLTKANWTPDIVASILATNAGLLLGGLLAFLAIYGTGAAIQVFCITLVFFSAWFFSITCYHMELEGHRHFQQGYLLLVPILGTFITLTTISVFAGKLAKSAIGTLAVDSLPDAAAAIPGTSELARNTAVSMVEPIFSKVATFSDIGGMTIAITLAVVTAFALTSAHRKMLRWYYLLPTLLFIGLGIIILAGGAALSRV